MFKEIKDIKVIKDIRINILINQAFSNVIEKAKKRYKEDLKRRFLS